MASSTGPSGCRGVAGLRPAWPVGRSWSSGKSTAASTASRPLAQSGRPRRLLGAASWLGRPPGPLGRPASRRPAG
eukprot:3944330-Alexandrium_andersonii.AAC.1